LYFHLWLTKAGNPTLAQYCKEGQEYEFGFDSAETPSGSDKSSDSDRKRGVAAAMVDIAEAAKKKANAIVAFNTTFAQGEQARLRACLWEQIDKLEDKIATLEERPDYNPDAPTARLMRTREELNNCLAERNALVTICVNDKTTNDTTPTNLSL
jgi:hypothetical protein